MAKDKNSFVLYTNYIDIINVLSNEQAGILFKQIYAYVNDLSPEEPTDAVVKIAWLSIKTALKADLKKWEDERKKRSEAGKKGMESRYSKDKNVITNDNNVKSAITKTNSVKNCLTNLTDIVNVNVNDNVDVIVNDIVNVNDIDIENNKVENIKKENISACTPYFVSLLLEEIKSKLPEMEDSTYISLEIFLNALTRTYSESNIRISTRHALLSTLEKYGEIDNTFGYLRVTIANNCEQFKEGSYHYDN